MSDYKGDVVAGQVIDFAFDTSDPTGAPITLGGSVAARVYKRGSASESSAGVSVSVDYDGLTGLHLVTVDTSADGTFYAAGNDFVTVLTVGTVGGINVAPKYLGSFSIANRSALSAAGVRTAIGLASANLDTQLDALPTNAELATALASADDATLLAIAALSIPTVSAIADGILGRNLAGGSNGGRTVRSALQVLRNKVVITPINATSGTIDVYDETDTGTPAWSGTVTRASADAIASVDPS